MKIFSLIALLLTLLYTGLPATSEASGESYCKANYRPAHRSVAACVNAEKKAIQWLAVNPVADDIYASCKRGSGESRGLLKDCILTERRKQRVRAASPLNLGNSRVWYAASLRDRFAAQLRVCNMETPVDDFAVLPTDITKFSFSTSLLYKDMLPILNVKGRVEVARVPIPMRVKKNNRGKPYTLYIDAFFITGDGRVLDISSVEAPAQLSSRGGTARFSFDIGKGYYFNKGGTILVVASGEPITTKYPGASCLLLGAKKITIKKK